MARQAWPLGVDLDLLAGLSSYTSPVARLTRELGSACSNTGTPRERAWCLARAVHPPRGRTAVPNPVLSRFDRQLGLEKGLFFPPRAAPRTKTEGRVPLSLAGRLAPQRLPSPPTTLV